jgi:hypothetical protein
MARLLVVILVLLAAAPMAASGDANPACESQLLAQATLHVTPAGEVFMPATIDGRDVYFRLSIGSGLPMVLESAVKSLGLQAKRRNGGASMSSGGNRITHFVMLEETKIGAFRLLARAAPVIPQPGVEAPPMVQGKPVVGYMGSTLFRNVDAELHLAERQLKLFKPFRCRSRSPVYWGGVAAELPLRFDPAGALIFTLELDGRKVEAGLLAGESISTIDVNATRKFFGFDETSAGVEVVQAEGENPRSLFHAMSLTGQGLGISNARVRLRGGSQCKLTGSTPGYGAIGYADCINRVPFNLGTDLLLQLRIYISREREKVYVSAAAVQPSGDAGTITIAPAR